MEQNGYIDIEEIPGYARSRTSKYPWSEWAQIPPGKALEVTASFQGVKAPQAAVQLKLRILGLKLVVRGEGTERRVWVAKR